MNLPQPAILTPTNAAILDFSTVLPQELNRPVFAPKRLNAHYGNIYQWQNASSSTYHGVSFALNRRLANEIEFSGSYTLSKTLDDTSDFTEQPQNPYELRAERAISANDQRHRFCSVALLIYHLPDEEEAEKPRGVWTKVFGNIEAAPILIIGSGRAVDPLVGFDANHNGAFPLSSRPFGFERNSLRTGIQAQLDLRVLKFFKVGEHGKLDVVAESFNLFNHTNVIAPESVLRSIQFPTSLVRHSKQGGYTATIAVFNRF